MKYFILKENIVYFPTKKLIVQFKNVEDIEQSIKRVLKSREWDLIYNCENELLKVPQNINFQDIHSYSIGIIPTSECNLRCIYCYSESGTCVKEELTKTQMDKIVSYLIKNAIMHKLAGNSDVKLQVSFCGGGEPTFNWQLFKYGVESIKERCCQNRISSEIVLTTNGMLNLEQVDYISQNINFINVSMDGPMFIQNHQRPNIVGKGSFCQVNNAIHRFENNNKKINVRVTVMPSNFDNINEIIDFFFGEYKNIEMIHIEPMYIVGRGRDISYDNDAIMRFMEKYISAYEYVETKYPDKKIYNSSFTYKYQEYSCSAAIGLSPWIHMNGNIMPCTENINQEAYIIGNFSDTNVIFKDEYKMLWSKPEKCEECFAYYHCGGDCPRNTIYNERDEIQIKHTDMLCNMIKEFWYKVFESLLNNKRICGMDAEYISIFENNEEIKKAICLVKGYYNG